MAAPMLIDAPFPVRSTATPQTAVAMEQAISRPAEVRAIQRLVLVIFWLLIMEGALRKWMLPGYSHILFFIRDPFVLLVYWYALRGGLFKRPSPFLVAGLVFAAIAPLLAMIQIAHISDNRMVTIVIYGWRQYFLYLPLPFVIARAVDEKFLWGFARQVFVAVILTAPLMFVQFHSPASSVLNRGSSEDEALQFKSGDLYEDKIRANGFFTSTAGVGNIVPAALALALAAWVTPAGRRRISILKLVPAVAATASCLAFSGSRGAFAAVALVVLSSMLVGLLVRDGGTRLRALVIPGVVCVIGAVLYPIVFPDAFETMMARAAITDTFGSGAGSYGIVGRAFHEVYDFVYLMGDAPFAGYGLGLGGNGRAFLGDESNALLQNAYAESDWQRHIVDLGPLIGVFFILYRVILTGDLLRRTVVATVRARDPLPVLLFGYVGIGVFYGQLTGNGTTGGFLWLFLGLTLASCRLALERSEQAANPVAA